MSRWSGRQRRGCTLNSDLIVIAQRARARFQSKVDLLIDSCLHEGRAPDTIVVVLEQTYAQMTADYINRRGGLVDTWIKHGPIDGLERARKWCAEQRGGTP